MSLPVKQGQMVVTLHKPSLRLVYLTLVVAILASLPWAWALHDQRAQADQLLADATVRSARVARLMIQYTSGAKSFVEIQEAPYERP